MTPVVAGAPSRGTGDRHAIRAGTDACPMHLEAAESLIDDVSSGEVIPLTRDISRMAVELGLHPLVSTIFILTFRL